MFFGGAFATSPTACTPVPAPVPRRLGMVTADVCTQQRSFVTMPSCTRCMNCIHDDGSNDAEWSNFSSGLLAKSPDTRPPSPPSWHAVWFAWGRVPRFAGYDDLAPIHPPSACHLHPYDIDVAGRHRCSLVGLLAKSPTARPQKAPLHVGCYGRGFDFGVAVRVGVLVTLKVLGVTEGLILMVVAVAVSAAVRVDVADLVSVGVREAVDVGMPAA